MHEKGKKLNVLYYYVYDEKNLKYQLQTKEDINFTKFGEKLSKCCFNFNYIGNIKKLKNGKIIFFTISTVIYNEKRNK